MEANRVIVKPVFNNGISQRRGEMDSRRKVGRQVQFDSRRQGVANAKPAMRAAQSKVVSPRQQTAPQRVQGRGRGRSTQAKPEVRGNAGPQQQQQSEDSRARRRRRSIQRSGCRAGCRTHEWPRWWSGGTRSGEGWPRERQQQGGNEGGEGNGFGRRPRRILVQGRQGP
ncbi:unnamed protein product [Ectocarpus sp. CCAP 1310/34]|nr:unnamed protein product [Ectocarpus sp. CCAP 1310/34]